MNNILTPVEGMGATLPVGSDRYACTIKTVINERTIAVVRDHAELVSGGPYTEDQRYVFSRNLRALPMIFTKRKNGKWVEQGSRMRNAQGLIIGFRDQYLDPHF